MVSSAIDLVLAALEIDQHFVALAGRDEDRLDLIRLGKDTAVPPHHGELVPFEAQTEVARVGCVREAPPLAGAVLDTNSPARAAVRQDDVPLSPKHQIGVHELARSGRSRRASRRREGRCDPPSRDRRLTAHEQHPIETTLDLDMRTDVRMKPEGTRIHHGELVIEGFTRVNVVLRRVGAVGPVRNPNAVPMNGRAFGELVPEMDDDGVTHVSFDRRSRNDGHGVRFGPVFVAPDLRCLSPTY